MTVIAQWPRMMRRSTAAVYCGLAPAKFVQEVAIGRLPAPVKLGGQDRWDRKAIDEGLDQIAGLPNDWRRDQPSLSQGDRRTEAERAFDRLEHLL
ncbi:hypothetical protein U1839_05990 [Sphingomonas sp. RT2P30]|uniref:hypothetical protein n=1 Tax=Parasphingomonas halimpatiens TaxID=3096162 RepID=UPI002FC880DB